MNDRLRSSLFAALSLFVGVVSPNCHALTTNSNGLVPYQSFNNQSYVLTPWLGTNVAFLVPTNFSPSSNDMEKILGALDSAWDFYGQATGQQPAPYDPTTLFGRDTIAVVNSTCGAGCSYIGFTGTELLSQYFSTLYNGVVIHNQYDQVLFYELGRNFWFYGNQLAYLSPDVDPVTTGFAVYMRFASMDAAGVAGGPYNGLTFTAFRSDETNLVDTYIRTTSVNWSNTFRLNQAPANPLNLGGTDLIASLLMRIAHSYGDSSFAINFWKQAALRPAAATTQDAVDNFILAACATVKTNLTWDFATTWKFPVSTNALQLAQQNWGAPPIVRPSIHTSTSAGTNLTLRWVSQWNYPYQLQSSTDLQAWSNFGSTISGNGSVQFVTIIPNSVGQQFFRLALP